jgi:uncharacterized cupin superfamily protein
VQQVTAENGIKVADLQVSLNLCPINPAWILEGNPVARNKVMSNSADGTACTLIWDCTAGRFNWIYDIDETVYVLEGSFSLKDRSGNIRRVVAGDTVFFPVGSQAEWTVETYVRKLAFCRKPLSRKIQLAKRVYSKLGSLLGRGAREDGAPSMFSNG